MSQFRPENMEFTSNIASLVMSPPFAELSRKRHITKGRGQEGLISRTKQRGGGGKVGQTGTYPRKIGMYTWYEINTWK